MDGPSSDNIQLEMDPAYLSIMSMMGQNDSSRVRSATAWLISQMVKFSP